MSFEKAVKRYNLNFNEGEDDDTTKALQPATKKSKQRIWGEFTRSAVN